MPSTLVCEGGPRASESAVSGTLYVVATPIGNLEDLTHRAQRLLGEVAFIVCEDTRHARFLLDHYGISKPLMSLPAFAEGERAGAILDRMAGGDDAALITDAGTPAISDPGEKLVAEALERGFKAVPVPGASAVLSALSVGGLPTGRFHFLGFLPRSGPERTEMLDEVQGLRATLVIYESPRRIVETLGELAVKLGDRRAVIARELTKLHEELARGTLSSLAETFGAREVLGEVVLLIEGRSAGGRWGEPEVLAALEAGLKRGERMKALSSEVAKAAGWTSADVYRLGVTLKGG